METRTWAKFQRMVKAELDKGQQRHGTPFTLEALLARGENPEECDQKEAVGLWLYADLLKNEQLKNYIQDTALRVFILLEKELQRGLK